MKVKLKNIISVTSLLTLLMALSVFGVVALVLINNTTMTFEEREKEPSGAYFSTYESSQPDLTTETLLEKKTIVSPNEVLVQSKQGIIKENQNRKVIKFEEELTEQEKVRIESEYNVDFTDDASQNGVYVLNVNPASKVEDLENSGIVYAMETDIPIKLLSQVTDWGVERVGANKIWSKATGSGVVVAVIDTGVQLDHEDLAANVISGFDFVNNNSNAYDDNGHGTHVAGIVVANNNSKGVVGIANGSKIMPIKVLNSQGYGYLSDVAKGIYYAADNNAKIINLSLGSTTHSTVLRDAVRYAYRKGVLIVGAAGNEGGQPCLYPAAYDEVICVVATNKDNKIASFSNIGGELAAPGVSNYSTYIGNRYAYLSGTSMATPHVAGAAAVVFSKCPSCTHVEVRNTLWNTAVDLGEPGRDGLFGYGLLDVFEAIRTYEEIIVEEEILDEPAEEEIEQEQERKEMKVVPAPLVVPKEVRERVQEKTQTKSGEVKAPVIQKLLLLEPDLLRNNRVSLENLEDLNLRFRLDPIISDSDLREISVFVDNEKVFSTQEQGGEYILSKEELTNNQYVVKVVASFKNSRIDHKTFIIDLSKTIPAKGNSRANPANPSNRKVLGIATFFQY